MLIIIYSHTKILKHTCHIHIFTITTSPNTYIHYTYNHTHICSHAPKFCIYRHTFTLIVTHIYMNTDAQIVRHTQSDSCTAVYFHGHSHTQKCAESQAHDIHEGYTLEPYSSLGTGPACGSFQKLLSTHHQEAAIPLLGF